jgi:CO/xanthine dehydrogenase FAD-binding subunit
VKPAAFRYFAPPSLDQALELLAEHGDQAKVLAGGQSLVPAMNFRLAQPAVLVDLNRVAELAYVEADGAGALRVGAMTRQRAVERSAEVARAAPLLRQAMPFIAHPQIRNRGTVGGSLAHADPAAELPAVALALDARFLLRRHGGERWVAAKDFYTGLFATALEPDEILSEISFQSPAERTGWSFHEVSRRHGDFALAGCAAGVTLDPDGRCAGARVVFFGVGEAPILAERAATTLAGAEVVGGVLAVATLAAVAEAAVAELEPPSDIHASSRFRRHLARTMAERAVGAAARDAALGSRPGRA